MMNIIPDNPGDCWVSIKCFQPLFVLNNWIFPTLKSLPNLSVYTMTVVKSAHSSGDTITSLTAITRSPKPGVDPWNQTLSDAVSEWYSPDDSSFFSKVTTQLQASVFVDATELGDLLAVSGASFAQGWETPDEFSTETTDTCGQAMTYTVFMRWESAKVPQENFPTPAYNNYSMQGSSWDRIWTYRRSLAEPGDTQVAKPSEISNQNWGGGNDYSMGYPFLSIADTLKQVSNWSGGLNLTSLQQAERRGWGWYTYYRQQANATVRDYLSLVREDVVGTATGVGKMPYLRDTRRSIGMDQFRLFYANMTGTSTSDTGDHFDDTVALGDYFYADIHPLSSTVCPNIPDDLKTGPIKPFYIPFRALTSQSFSNLLVAVKTMAQTFHANAATRLHPVEWHSGTAAGVAAALMVENGWDTRDMYDHVSVLQSKVVDYAPITWTL
eukprot:Em0007g1317a